jgi:hypothetical protein
MPYVTAEQCRREGFDMTHNDPSKQDPRASGKERDKYGGVVEFDMALTPSVIICGAAGAVLGAILAMVGAWLIRDPEISAEKRRAEFGDQLLVVLRVIRGSSVL